MKISICLFVFIMAYAALYPMGYNKEYYNVYNLNKHVIIDSDSNIVLNEYRYTGRLNEKFFVVSDKFNGIIIDGDSKIFDIFDAESRKIVNRGFQWYQKLAFHPGLICLRRNDSLLYFDYNMNFKFGVKGEYSYSFNNDYLLI